ncbi:hypothetical protein SBOR_2981 [Sclerotinia borealis F-4128]|uniref:UBC core domain-containing protein n=1 Tax=Sclerotinia borealis (strain F-4128) TaxID=1432307 RepID=W9CPQ3_SCLBF|nr:hypothetical protein SBOR_2981 [Sclerotinia borealis F-4128]
MSKRRLSDSSVDTLALEAEARNIRIHTTSAQRTRIIVNFNDLSSTKFIIPVTSSTTIAELKDQVLHRAERLGAKISHGTTELRLESEYGPITFPEDTIEDIFGNVDPKLIWVISAHQNNSDDDDDAEPVYVRWITPGRALDHLSLSDIETDKEPLTRGIRVDGVTTIAKNRLFGAAGDEITPAPGFNIGLWFSRTGDDNTIFGTVGTDTIGGLGLSGSLENPLNAFLVLISSRDPDPNSLYGFRCSNRGMATFQTCLKVLITAATFRPYLIPLLLERMMQITNISEARNVLGGILPLRMVPGALINHRFESVLEGSRQIFACMFGDILEENVKPVKGNRMPLPAMTEFRLLLSACNASPYFQMLSPLQLDGRENSGISLSKDGYVSHYTTHGDETSQSRLENTITGIETLQSRPGESLLYALQPVISQRRIDGTWEIDDWASPSMALGDYSGPDEAIVICLDQSSSMNSPLGEDWIGNGQPNSLSRFDEAKQVFRNVASRFAAYRLNIHVGLVVFGTEVETQAEIAPIGKDFKNALENPKATDKRTALFDAIDTAHDMLYTYKEEHPESKTKLRIIALTDGQDNISKTSPEHICEWLCHTDIVLDSIFIGGSSPKDLFKMSKHTGGYAFQPTSRLLLFQTFLLEPFLDILARPDIVKIPIDDYETSLPKEPDMTTFHDFPPCRPHKLQDGGFVWLDAATLRLAGNSSSLLEMVRTSASAEPSNRSSGRLYLDEMRLMIANPHASMDVYVSEVDMAFWKIIMSGLASIAYSQGTFALFVHMTETYPQKAPTVRFITPVLHPNVSKQGRICHEIFDDGWKSSLHIHNILKTVFTLFENPKASCDAAIDELATLKFWTDRATADKEIKKYVAKFATRTRLEWKTEMDAAI